MEVNLSVGPDASGHGGVSSVLSSLKFHGFFDKTNTEFIGTGIGNRKVFSLRWFSFAHAFIRLVLLLTFRKVGLVHFHMASKGSFLRKSILARTAHLFGVPYIIHLHGGGFDKFYAASSASKQKRIEQCFRRASKVIVLSQGWKQWVDTTFNIDSVVVYNFVAAPKRQDSLVEHDAEHPSILFLGLLTPQKGVDDLLTAFKQVIAHHPSATLVLAGNGDQARYTTMAQTLGIAKQVYFAGWVSGDDKAALLQQASMYVLPSYAEGFPMGVLEAMAQELAVVATDVGGIPDAISNGHEGLLCKPGDVDALAQHMITLLDDKNRCKELAKAGREKYLRCFSPDVILPQLEAIYSEVLQKKRA